VFVHVDPTERVAGYPVLVVRDALRHLRMENLDARSWGLEIVPRLVFTHTDADELRRALVAEGYIVDPADPEEDPTLRLAPAGERLIAARGTPLVPRRKAAAAIDGLLARARALNDDDGWPYRVVRVLLFGGYLTGTEPFVGDVDVGVELDFRWADRDRQEREEWAFSQARRLRFDNLAQLVTYPREAAKAFLRGKGPVLDVSEASTVVGRGFPHLVVFDAADPSRAVAPPPPPAADAPKPPRRARRAPPAFTDAERTALTKVRELRPDDDVVYRPRSSVVECGRWALDALRRNGVTLGAFVDRHCRGDWGVLGDVDRALNDGQLAHRWPERLCSAFDLADGTRLYVVSGLVETCAFTRDDDSPVWARRGNLLRSWAAHGVPPTSEWRTA
jgi:hypothetical protein